MAKRVETFKTLEEAKAAADKQFAEFGWFIAVLPIWTTGRFMLSASKSDDMVYSVGVEESEE